MEFPRLRDVADLGKFLRSSPNLADARQCLVYGNNGAPVVRYPCLGVPLPHQPKVCKAMCGNPPKMCGVGGHTAKTHDRPIVLATRALTQAVWLLEYMDTMAPQEVHKQIMAMLHVLCALELCRQEQEQQGFRAPTSEIKSILVMYATVTEAWGNRVFCIEKTKTRNFRSTTLVLNDALSTLTRGAPAIPVDFLDVDEPSPEAQALFFPFPSLDDNLQRVQALCDTAFREAGSAWIVDTQRELQGHWPHCGLDKTCTCVLGSLKARVLVPRNMSTCQACGLLGHNKGSCPRRNTATHIATALATMIDPSKMSRMTAQAVHLGLYNCYHMLVALLYGWWSNDLGRENTWTLGGLSRLVFEGTNSPTLLLRLFNHALVTLRRHPRFGKGLAIVGDEGVLRLDAAHRYESISYGKRKPKPETLALKHKATEMTKEFQDEEFFLSTQNAVRDMVVQSAAEYAPVADDLRKQETDIGLRFGFEDIF